MNHRMPKTVVVLLNTTPIFLGMMSSTYSKHYPVYTPTYVFNAVNQMIIFI